MTYMSYRAWNCFLCDDADAELAPARLQKSYAFSKPLRQQANKTDRH